MKKLHKDIDATPSKRIYLSIISDYDLKLGLCELIDNAIDSWTYKNKTKKLLVNINLDYQQQRINVTDNSGGIPESEIRLIISPGESRNEQDAESIGIFGVGSKRAVVALAQKTAISSRYKDKETMLIEIDDDWIKDDSWDINVYKTNEIPENTTIIELSSLRNVIEESEQDRLIQHLGSTYSSFLSNGMFELKLNGSLVEPISYESWSYPKNYHPKRYHGKIELDESNIVSFEIIAGLTRKGDPAKSEYGVYFYCNDRLISKANKSYELGYKTGKAGHPHPAISLARVIIKLEGKAQLMPWNSSKSEINMKHKTFKELVPHIEKIVANYSRASRSMDDDWNKNVFQYKNGDVENISLENLSSNSNLYLVPIPRRKTVKYIDLIKKINKQTANDRPWTKGIYESIIAVNEISKIKVEQKNRILLLLLDSTLEIAFKEFLVNEVEERYSETRLQNIMKNRHEVHSEIKSKTDINAQIWRKIDYFYNLRSELVHKRVSISISDEDIINFRSTVENVLKKMFDLKFSDN